MGRMKIKYGDKVTYKRINGEIITSILGKSFDGSDLENLNNHLGKVLSIERPNYQKIYNCEILDKIERRYLSAVIRPFRSNVRYIRKCESGWLNEEFIIIVLKKEAISLPCFKKGTMYKRMITYKEYTIEELNL